MKTNDEADRLSHEPCGDDYTWRFELVRSTLEDFSQLMEDETSGSNAIRMSTDRLPFAQRETCLPALTFSLSRGAAMTA